MTCAPPVCGARAAITSRRAGCASSTSEISRATARGEPALADSTRAGTSTVRGAKRSGLGHADDEGVALAPATAQRGRADPAAATAQLEAQVQRETGARHADRVPERDGAAVDVDLVQVQPELLGRGQPDRGERLVDLDEVEVGGTDALALARLRDGPGGLLLQGRVGTGDDPVGAD